MNLRNTVAENHQSVENKTFDLGKLLERIHATCLEQIDDEKIEFSFDPVELPVSLVFGIAEDLEEVFTSMLNQARKSIVEGRIAIQVKMMMRSNHHFIIRFKLKAEGQHSLVMGSTDGSKDTSQFNIVKKHVEQLGGSLEYNETSKGTKVYSLVLPFEDSGIEIPLAADPEAVQGELLRTTSILLVTNNEGNDNDYLSLFKKWNCKYEVQRDPGKVVELLEKQIFNFVFINVNEDEKELINLSEKLSKKELCSNKRTTIVAFTEVSTSSANKQKLGNYCNKLIIKPFDENRLRQLIVKSVETHIQKPDPRNKCFNRN
ncbi:MAG: hypothetical protein AB8F74_09490 [Saprospiraceae bacterium]